MKEGPTCGRASWLHALRLNEQLEDALPCGGGGDGLGLRGEFGDDAELLHEAESVPVDIAFDHLVVREADGGRAGECGGRLHRR